MIGELTDSLRAASSCWDLCADAADRPYATVVRDVARVELQRATWLVQGLQVLGEQPAMNRTRVNVGVLLEQTRPGGHFAGVNAAAVTRVVDLHGGRLTVESLQPQGLRVSVGLPLTPA